MLLDSTTNIEHDWIPGLCTSWTYFIGDVLQNFATLCFRCCLLVHKYRRTSLNLNVARHLMLMSDYTKQTMFYVNTETRIGTFGRLRAKNLLHGKTLLIDFWTASVKIVFSHDSSSLF